MIKIISIARLHPHSTPCKKIKKEKDEILNLWENLNNSQISKCIKVRKMFFSSCNERGIKKYSESPWGIDLRPSDLRSDAQPLSHKDSSVSEAYYEVLITRFPHTVRISNVDSVMFLIKKIVEMVSFELPRSWQDKKIFFNPSPSSKLTISTICIKNITLSTLLIASSKCSGHIGWKGN